MIKEIYTDKIVSAALLGVQGAVTFYQVKISFFLYMAKPDFSHYKCPSSSYEVIVKSPNVTNLSLKANI